MLKKSWLRRCYGENLRVFLAFELVYAALLLAGLYPMARAAVSWVMRLCGFGYLTAENAGAFLRNPLAMALVGVILVLWTLIPLVGIIGIAVLTDASSRKIRCRLDAVVRRAVSDALRIFRKENLVLLPLMIPFVIFTHLANTIRLGWNFLPASFWNGLLRKRLWSAILFGLAVLLMIWIFIRLRYLFSIWSLERVSVFKAARKSYCMTKKGWLGSFLRLLAIEALMFGIYAASLIVFTVLTTVIGNLAGLPGVNITSFLAVLQKVCFAIYDTMICPVIFTLVCFRYTTVRKEEKDDPVTDMETEDRLKKLQETRAGGNALLLLGSVLILAFYIYSSASGRYRLHVEGMETMQVTAHRGASMQRPENTMAAFAEAAEQGADWIELDVHESADGQIFVMHDKSFIRTAGVDAYVWQLNWDEISRLDVGSYFGPEYKGERIPLLAEVMEFAHENGVRLNIELKPTGHEKALVENVVRIIEEYGYEEDCVVTSQSYSTVAKVKECDENIRTVYVSGLAYGAVNRMTAADAFSVQSVSISRSLVRNLHNRGIEVYAWTVDSRKNINRMIDYGVDNIITNNVPLAKKIIAENQTSGLINGIFHSLDAMFS